MLKFVSVCLTCFLFVSSALPYPGGLVAVAEAQLSQRQKAIRQFRRRAFNEQVQIQSIVAYDRGSLAESAVDTTLDTLQETCDDSSDEPFFDTLIGIKLWNQRLANLQVRKINFVVRKAFSDRGKFKTPRFSPVGNSHIAGSTQGEVTALFLDTDGSRKYYAGAADPIPVDLGFRNVKVRVVGRDFAGGKFRAVARTSFSLGNPDRCS